MEMHNNMQAYYLPVDKQITHSDWRVDNQLSKCNWRRLLRQTFLPFCTARFKMFESIRTSVHATRFGCTHPNNHSTQWFPQLEYLPSVCSSAGAATALISGGETAWAAPADHYVRIGNRRAPATDPARIISKKRRAASRREKRRMQPWTFRSNKQFMFLVGQFLVRLLFLWQGLCKIPGHPSKGLYQLGDHGSGMWTYNIGRAIRRCSLLKTLSFKCKPPNESMRSNRKSSVLPRWTLFSSAATNTVDQCFFWD